MSTPSDTPEIRPALAPEEADDARPRLRTCSVCSDTKPLDLFEKKKDRPFGRAHRCKACSRQRAREYYRRNADERRECAKKYQRRKPKKRLSYSELKERYPKKTRARYLLRNAVADGRIEKPDSCQECGGSQALIHGHHEDYNKPLEVEWLCHDCHMVRHRVVE